MNSFLEFSAFLIVFQVITLCGNLKKDTKVSIEGDRWFINGKVLNAGSPAEGLLMNVRMVNAVFEDRGAELSKFNNAFDPKQNTDHFVSMIPEYIANGINCFTISLQGGAPGYEGAVNSAFESDGTLRVDYMERVAEVIDACNENSCIVILSCFYQRQHSNFSSLDGKEAIMNALKNTVLWIKKNHFRNVLLEVSNEYRHGGYKKWKDGEWLSDNEGQVDLIKLAKSLYPSLLVSTSDMGDGRSNTSLADAVDYVSIHFNNTSFENYEERIKANKKFGKPVVCNEDDKLKEVGVNALVLSVMNGCGWGYMNSRQNQSMPFKFEGVRDDTVIYKMMKKITSPGYLIDQSVYKQTSLIITYPNDGDVFRTGQRIIIKFSHLFPDPSGKFSIKILSNSNPIGLISDNKNQFSWQLNEPGTIIFEALVTDLEGNVLLRSPKVDILVQEDAERK
jgi:hypothetical protein